MGTLQEHIETIASDIRALLPQYRQRVDGEMVDFIERYLRSLSFDAYQATVADDASKLVLIYEEVSELLRDIKASLDAE